MTTTTPDEGVKASRKRTIKSKLDDSILEKARKALGLPVPSKDEEDDQKNEQPSLKWRKPRHNTEEGQLYIKNKEKRRKLEDQESGGRAKNPVPKSDDKKGKKKRKNKKKKKAGVATVPESNSSTGGDVGENKHMREAISYLQLWQSNRDHWKFVKRNQTWLLKNCLNSSLIDDTRFETLLEYIASVKGAARKATLNEMENVIKRWEGEEDAEGGARSGGSENTVSEVMYERARQILQILVD